MVNFDPNTVPGVISDPCRCFDTIQCTNHQGMKELISNSARDFHYCLEKRIIVRSYMFRAPPLFSLAYYSQQHVHKVPGMVCIASQPAHPCLN